MRKYQKRISNLLLFLAFFVGAFWDVSQHDNAKAEELKSRKEKSVEAKSNTLSDNREDIDMDDSSMPPGTVRISYEKQQMIGIRTGVAEKHAVTASLRLLGTVAPDENRVFKVKAAVDGIILEAYPVTTGSMVKKNQPLATYYSPDIYAAEQGYLIALSSDRYQNNLQVQVNESRLKYLGMSASQIEELKNHQEIEEAIMMRSPGLGFILSRNVSPDLRFLKGDELYRIAALDRVWIFADVYENEARYLKPKDSVKISHPQLGKEFSAQVSDVLPLFDAATRTFKVRLEAENPEFLLRPGMFVNIEMPIHFPPSITVPADAILDSGLKKIVFADRGEGVFEPREVETGWHFDNLVEIQNGIEPGERIAMSGTFLIDSESRLAMTAEGLYETLSKDPVSGLDVSINKAEKAGKKSVYNGKTYYFATDRNKKQFDQSPDQYITP